MTDRIITDTNGRKHITQEPVNARGQPSPSRTDFKTWDRSTLEKFAREAADENKQLRDDLRTAINAYRKAVSEQQK